MKYVIDLLAKTGIFGCKYADTLIKMNYKLCEDINQLQTNKKQY